MLELLFNLRNNFESLCLNWLNYRLLLFIVIDFSLKLLLFLAFDITDGKRGR